MTRLFTAALLAASLATPVFAVGSESSEPPETTKTSTDCKKGQVWDKKKKACLDVKSEAVTDDDRYHAARELAYNGQYDRAMDVLASAENQNDPRILNYYGFTNRKLGNDDLAMKYYQAALAIDPDYILARSYMGQGLAAKGDIVGAVEQLEEIRLRSGTETWAYASLEKAIAGTSSDW